MEAPAMVGLAVALFLVLLAMGLEIPLALLFAGGTGVFLIQGVDGFAVVARLGFSSSNSFILLAVPLFMLMGTLIDSTGLGDDLYTALQAWLSRIPGGLFIANILGGTLLSACTGSSAAVAATMSRAAIPRLMERKCDKALSCGSIAGGTLGSLIPPSIGFVVYGFLTDTSVGQLFLAGIVPAFILEAGFIVYTVARVARQPSLCPSGGDFTWKQRFVSLRTVWPFPLIVIGILGSIYLGIATPTESAAIGVFVVLLIALARRKLNVSSLKDSLVGAARTTSWIMVIVVAGGILGYLVAWAGIGDILQSWVTGTGMAGWVALAAMILVFLVLGCFLDGMSIMVLTIPVFLPIVVAMGYSPLWFGVFAVLLIEIGLETPPVGIEAFVIAGIVKQHGISLEQVFKGLAGYVLIMVVGAVALLFWPTMALWLPSKMF